MLLRQPAVADDFWKQGYETGIGIHFASVLSAFPQSLRSLTELCIDLVSKENLLVFIVHSSPTLFRLQIFFLPQSSSGSYNSANYVLACLEKLSVYAEPIDISTDVEMLMKGSSDKWRLLGTRFFNFAGQRGQKPTSLTID